MAEGKQTEPERKKKRIIFTLASFWIFLSLLSLTIIGLEFFIDLSQEVFLQQVVVSLDALLILSYAALIVGMAIKERKQFFKWALRQKLDLLTLFFSLILLFSPRSAAGLIIIRILIKLSSRAISTPTGQRMVAKINLMPSQTLALSFLATIAVGTLLLMFPAATPSGHGASFLDALFTITSATCVVGLSVVDIGHYFSFFGQAVILLAIQVGGLGIMVLGAAFAVLVGGHIPTRRQVGLRDILDVSTPEGLRKLMTAVATATFVTEFLGALFLYFLWIDDLPDTGQRIWWAVFHAVSAFCNAGFGLASDNLLRWVNDPLVSLVVMSLITVGGIGFFVISDIIDRDHWKILRPSAIWNRFHTQTKIVLIATLLLNSLGMLLFLFFEYDGALKGLSIGSKIVASLFHAVALRTAGFNTVSFSHLAAPTIIFCICWMFIGASPGSTGGGVKTTTAAVCLMTLRAMLWGRGDVEILNRRVPPIIVNRSLSIVLVSTLIIVVFLTFLTATQELPFERLFFEVLSAFGTVGFTVDTTTKLDSIGRVLIIIVMYIGRIGPLTLALAIGERKLARGYRYPEGRMAVG